MGSVEWVVVSGCGWHHFLLGVLVGRLPLGAHLEDLPDAHRQDPNVLELLDPELREVVAAGRVVFSDLGRNHISRNQFYQTSSACQLMTTTANSYPKEVPLPGLYRTPSTSN